MRTSSLLVPLALLAVSGCTEPECPPGQERRGDVCFDMDADADADSDAGADTDAGAVLELDAESTEAAVPEAGVDAADSSSVCKPATAELCNGLDDDCDGEIDEGALVYADYDGDGTGAGAARTGCPPSGVSAVVGDCDDANPKINPKAQEICNGVDDDCDGETDEGVKATVFQDADGDEHGNPQLPKVVCIGAVAAGFVLSADDCDDTCATCSPDKAQELACDGKDDDCDGQLDDGLTRSLLLDCDGDNYAGSPLRKLTGCLSAAPPAGCSGGRWLLEETLTPGQLDCNDLSPSVQPGATERCQDGLDTNCDGDASSTESNCT